MSLQELNQIRTLEQIESARLSDLAPHIHILIGKGSGCMCGVYDGQSLTCGEILSKKSTDILSAIVASRLRAEGFKIAYPADI